MVNHSSQEVVLISGFSLMEPLHIFLELQVFGLDYYLAEHSSTKVLHFTFYYILLLCDTVHLLLSFYVHTVFPICNFLCFRHQR